MKYNIGDLFIIPFVEKIGIIIEVDNHNYNVFWQYKNGLTDTVWVDEKTINLWLSKREGKRTSPPNQYFQVPK